MFKRIDHVVIATEDLEDAARLWERNLGLKPDASLDRPRGSGFMVSRMPVGDAFLELAQPEGEGPYGDWLRQQAEGMCLVGIEVDDLAAAVTHLRARGAQVSEARTGGVPGVSLALVDTASTHGVPIALVQRSK